MDPSGKVQDNLGPFRLGRRRAHEGEWQASWVDLRSLRILRRGHTGNRFVQATCR